MTERQHRSYVGSPDVWDQMAGHIFCTMFNAGLKGNHTVLDIGCGSLRVGRLLIPYLEADRYYGVDPNQWLVDNAVGNEIGRDIVTIKRPTFAYFYDFQFQLRWPDKEFDFVMAHSIYTHSPRHMIKECSVEVGKVLKPSGLFFATFHEGSVDSEFSEWEYPGLTSYTVPTVEKLITDGTGLRIIKRDLPHPRGHKWLVMKKE